MLDTLTKINVASVSLHQILPDNDPRDPTALLDRWKNDNLKIIELNQFPCLLLRQVTLYC